MKRDVAETVGQLLYFFEEQQIQNFSDVAKNVGKRFPLKRQPDFIEVSMRPSNVGTQTLTMSYVIPYLQGIALELKMNATLRYSQIILKADELLTGYSIFAFDPWKNIVQNKVLETILFEEIREELLRLRELH